MVVVIDNAVVEENVVVSVVLGAGVHHRSVRVVAVVISVEVPSSLAFEGVVFVVDGGVVMSHIWNIRNFYRIHPYRVYMVEYV